MVWFWWWLVFVLVVLLLPLLYGWAYRGWGPPSLRPRHRPRPDEEEQVEQAAAEEAAGWGLLAGFVWITFFIALAWLVAALITVVR